MSDFNLLDEKWIPVLYQNGEFTRIGIKKTFEDAHLISQIASSNPMDRVSLTRFLLAMLYWCRGNPQEEDEFPSKFPMEWFKKLDENQECFNLLGDGKRFYQDESVKNNSKLSASSLIHEIPTGTSIYHFRHSLDEKDGLCPECCALGLIRLPVFTTQGGQGKGPGINKKPPIYIIPFGKSLFETLKFSYKPVSNLGFPSWDSNKTINNSDKEVPLLNGLTYLPRLVWLDEPKSVGKCVNCGSNGPLILKCVYNGVINRSDEIWYDPHIATIDNKSMSADNPIKIWFKTDRPWANLLNHFSNDEQNLIGNFNIVGFASDQAKHIDIWERNIKKSYSQDLAPDSLTGFAENWDKSVKKFPNAIKDQRREKNITEHSVIRSLRPHVENQISSNFNEFINRKIIPWEYASAEFKNIMPSIASSISPGIITPQVSRRKRIIKGIDQDVQTNKKKSSKKNNKGEKNE